MKALLPWSLETIELAHAYRDVDRELVRLVKPAPGGCLVLAFQWEEGRTPQLLVRDIRTGTILHEAALPNADDPFRKQSMCTLVKHFKINHF